MPNSSDKYIGMALAVLASFGIGASSIVAKIVCIILVGLGVLIAHTHAHRA